MVIPTDAPEPTKQPKGRSNAILTYELIAKFDNKLTGVIMQLASLIENSKAQEADHKTDHTDHEVRLRVIEKAQIASDAARAQSTGQWQWVWGAATVLVTIVIQLVTLYLNNKGSTH